MKGGPQIGQMGGPLIGYPTIAVSSRALTRKGKPGHLNCRVSYLRPSHLSYLRPSFHIFMSYILFQALLGGPYLGYDTVPASRLPKNFFFRFPRRASNRKRTDLLSMFLFRAEMSVSHIRSGSVRSSMPK